MKMNSVEIKDTFAEAWELEVVRLVITAISEDIAMEAAHQFVGAAGSSELGSNVSGGIEGSVSPSETPDGRSGVAVQLTMPPGEHEQLVDQLALRVVLSTLVPSCAVFDFPASDVETESIDLYGETEDNWEGHDCEEVISGHEMAVTPTTTGSFKYEKEVSYSTEGTDGHFVCYADNESEAIFAVKAAKAAIKDIDGVSPMGYGLEQVYREWDYVPALRDEIEDSKVPEDVNSILNLLMFGSSMDKMENAMEAGLRAATNSGDLISIGAMNFGGEFGSYEYHLHDLLEA